MSEKRIYIVECVDSESSLKDLIEYLGKHGNGGHSFSIIVDPDTSEADGGNKHFGWDGDGSDRIISVKEKQIAQDGKPMKRLKEIVGLLEQIVPLVVGGQDGGPGSGIKGHTTAENTPGKETLAQRQAVVAARNKTHGALSGMAVGKGLKHNNTPETLYKEGMGAAHSRAKQADSPYEKGSPEHKHWLAGYKSYGHGGK